MLSCRENFNIWCDLAHVKNYLIGCMRFFFSPARGVLSSVWYMPFFYGWVMRTMTSFSLVDKRNGTLFITWKGLCLLIWGLKLTITQESPTAYLTLSCWAKMKRMEKHVQLVAQGFVRGNLCSCRNLYLLFKLMPRLAEIHFVECSQAQWNNHTKKGRFKSLYWRRIDL